jgi:hypothetical protein
LSLVLGSWKTLLQSEVFLSTFFYLKKHGVIKFSPGTLSDHSYQKFTKRRLKERAKTVCYAVTKTTNMLE